MGHHNAQLDPLGISCVNFDDAPVNTGFQDVGENMGAKLLTVCGVNVALPPTLLSFSSSSFSSFFLLFLSFAPLFFFLSFLPLLCSFLPNIPPLTTFPFHPFSSIFLLPSSPFCYLSLSFYFFASFSKPLICPILDSTLLPLTAFCSLHLVPTSASPSPSPSPPPHPFYSSSCPGWALCCCHPCRSEGITWPSWTRSASWTLIWTRASPLTLSPPPTSWVRSSALSWGHACLRPSCAGLGEVFSASLRFFVQVSCAAAEDLCCSSGAQNMFLEPLNVLRRV